MAQIHVIGGTGQSLELPAVRKIGLIHAPERIA